MASFFSSAFCWIVLSSLFLHKQYVLHKLQLNKKQDNCQIFSDYMTHSPSSYSVLSEKDRSSVVKL